jgi:hypothetical protein
MLLATRCPECRAKLRLDTSPDPGETIECPKCGSLFSPDDEAEPVDEAPPPKVKKRKKEKKPLAPVGPAGPRKRKVKKKKTNPVLLFGSLGVALVFVITLGGFLFWYMGQAGKVEEMLCYVPGECNLVRGVNTGQIGKYPGFASEMDPFITPQINTAANDLATMIGFDDGDEMKDYVIIAKSKKGPGSTGRVYIFKAKRSFPKPDPLSGASGMKAADANGTTYYRSSGGGLLANANIFTPTSKLVVVVAAGPQQAELTNAVAAGGVKNKENMFAGKAGDTGRKISTGNMWLLIRTEGPLKNYAKDMGATVKQSFPAFAKACESAQVMGWWTSYGSKGINFGGGVDCGDSTQAWEVVSSMRESELGKQDDAEIPNDMKRAVSSSGNKEFREFLAWLKFRGYGSCAYFTARMSGENGKNYSRFFNGAQLAGWSDDDNANEAGGGGGGDRRGGGGLGRP